MPGDIQELQGSPSHIAILKNAQKKLADGQYSAAGQLYQDLARRFPKVAELWLELASSAVGTWDLRLAESALQNARDLSHSNARLLVLIGRKYQEMRDTRSAQDCFQEAIVTDPLSADARITLAMELEKNRNLASAGEQVETILRQNPGDDQARYFNALLHHRRGHLQDAEKALRDLIQSQPRYPYVRHASRHLLALVLEDMGRHQEALDWLMQSKAMVQALVNPGILISQYEQDIQTRFRLVQSLSRETVQEWQAANQDSPCNIAFLGGHPRSGTTLLEQILDAHEEILALDESPAFNHFIAGRTGLATGSGHSQLRRLQSLTPGEVALARKKYMEAMLHESRADSLPGILVDKNPSLTTWLPHWLRFFPGVKILIALRDPRDVVISSFFLNSVLNSTNVNFLTLERTVKHYCDLMDFWLRLRDLGAFAWHEVRYEDIVADTEDFGARATQFLGLKWNTQQKQFHMDPRPKFFLAPTHHEARQPVYGRAVGRHQGHAAALEPWMKKLTPYCRTFGYST